MLIIFKIYKSVQRILSKRRDKGKDRLYLVMMMRHLKLFSLNEVPDFELPSLKPETIICGASKTSTSSKNPRSKNVVLISPWKGVCSEPAEKARLMYRHSFQFNLQV